MARVTIEDCLRRVGNRFFLVHAVAGRVRQMRQNAQYWAGSPQGKQIVTALREIAAGKINIKDNNLRTKRRNEGVPMSHQGIKSLRDFI